MVETDPSYYYWDLNRFCHQRCHYRRIRNRSAKSVLGDHSDAKSDKSVSFAFLKNSLILGRKTKRKAYVITRRKAQ